MFAPVVVSALAGLVVVGLLALVMLTPHGSTAGDMPAATAGGTAPPAVLLPAPARGHPAPDFTLNLLDGGAVQLSAYRGKPVWVTFWATWCPPCRAEMPALRAVYPTYHAKGIEFLDIDLQEAPATVRQYVTAQGLDWTVALDTDGAVARHYYVSGIPTHVFVGRDGVIKDLVVAPLDQATMEAEANRLLAP